jgi:hypothetical protein
MDGSGDKGVQPEGIAGYTFPRPTAMTEDDGEQEGVAGDDVLGEEDAIDAELAQRQARFCRELFD